MLDSLYVKNLALIDEIECNFSDGLNIVTGETGAGKSIIIGSINLALGAKADKELIREGTEYALIELTFLDHREETRKALQEMDIPIEGDTIVISRRIMAGRSVSKINGETVTNKQVKALADVLIDIHGQHEHQSLLQKKKQAEILDVFAGEKMQELLQKMSEEYKCYKACKNKLESETVDENVRRRELELVQFEVGEIEDIKPQIGEDITLEDKYRKMLHARKISQSLGVSASLLGTEEPEAIGNQIGRALREVKSVSEYDSKIAEYEEILFQIEQLCTEYYRSVSDYLDDMEFEPEDFAKVEERLNLLNRLKDKYGKSIEDVLSYCENAKQKMEKYMDYDAYIVTLQEELGVLEGVIRKRADEIHELRVESAKILEKELTVSLEEMNFAQVNFSISLQKNEQITAMGYDDVEFLISTNPGESIRPLEQVASGGELSRIMLAIKTIFADKDDIETLIFDEIDTGISGKTAWKISEKIGKLSRNHQILCITHLPQIAAMADHHFRIEKEVVGNSTHTKMSVLNEELSLQELARLLGGEQITDAVLCNAKEMREMANLEKNSIMKS